MHKRSLILALLALPALWACEAPKPPAPKAEKPIKIGFSVPSRMETRWARDVEEMKKHAVSMGVELLVETANNDAAQQLTQCEAMLAKGLSVLIVAPQDARGAAEIVRRARKAGAKVIAYDRMIMEEAPDLYVSFDNEMVGRMQARSLAALAPRGNYLVLSGPPSDNNAVLYRRSALEVLGPLAARGDIKIVMDAHVHDWQAGAARKLAEKALAMTRGNLRAVLAPNDTTAGAVIEALAVRGLAGKVAVSGQDSEPAAVKRVLAGTQSMTVFKDPRHQTGAAFGAAMTLASGGRPSEIVRMSNGAAEVPSLLLAPLLVDKSNLSQVLIGTGFMKSGELYGE